MNLNTTDYTILVVDDILSNVLLLKALLKQKGYNFISAMNGEDALEMIRSQKPDLVLLDVMMPGMTGFELAEILRQDPETHDLPIIFLTALGDTSNVEKGFDKGASDYVSKPFQKDELFSRIGYQLMLRNAYRTINEQNIAYHRASEKMREISERIDSLLLTEKISPELKQSIDELMDVSHILQQQVN